MRAIFPVAAETARRYNQSPHMADPQDLSEPQEGMTTLSVQFTRNLMNRLIKAVQDLRREGMSETRIIEKMKEELKHVDEHSLRRIYDRSIGNPVPDDITEPMVRARREVKTGVVELDLAELPSHCHLGTLLQLDGEDWCLTRRVGSMLTLRRIQ